MGRRISVIGTSGVGKTHLARKLGGTLGLPVIELDAINWQAGWRDLNSHDPTGFRDRVREAVSADSWVCDGNYHLVQPLVLARATHLVWLDYERPVIMARVISRTLSRLLLSTELWAGKIRWAWTTWERRRRETAERLARSEYAQLVVLRLRRPGEVPRAIACLAKAAPMQTSAREARSSAPF